MWTIETKREQVFKSLKSGFVERDVWRVVNAETGQSTDWLLRRPDVEAILDSLTAGTGDITGAIYWLVPISDKSND